MSSEGIWNASRGRLRFAALLEAEFRDGRTLDKLVSQVATDRLALARGLKRSGDVLFRSGLRRHDSYAVRASVSRYYYSMFQACRAVVFVDYGGDDKNAHQELPKHLPPGFQSRSRFVNDLKNARVHRNGADYDPLPVEIDYWRPIADAVRANCADFLGACESFLKERGVE